MWLQHVGDTVQHKSQSTKIALDQELSQKVTAPTLTQKECYVKLTKTITAGPIAYKVLQIHCICSKATSKNN